MSNFIMFSIDVFASIFIIALGLIVLTVIIFYFRDITQTKHAIRRNYPVIGRFRYFFERQGEFFRQYFFAQDLTALSVVGFTAQQKMSIAPLHLVQHKA